MGSWLQPVEEALDAAREPVPVFFRDDDAGWDDARLLALLDASRRAALPVDLAVIPRALDGGAGARARRAAGGWACTSTASPTPTTSARGASASSGRRAARGSAPRHRGRPRAA